MAGNANSGRQPLGREKAIIRWYEDIIPETFKVVEEMLRSPVKKDRLWAMDWLKTGLVKMIPQVQKVSGNENDQTPIPVTLLQDVQRNYSVKEGSVTEAPVTDNSGRHFSGQDNSNPADTDRPSPETTE